MINQQERYYNILKLNKWFAISSILFTLIWLLVFSNDFNRPWKKYQIEFRELEIEKTRADIEIANINLDENEDYAILKVQFEEALTKVKSRQDEIESIQNKIQNLEAELYAKNQIFQFAKADLDVAKYDFEQAEHGHGDLASTKKEYEKLSQLTSSSKLEAEIVTSKIEIANNELKFIRQSLKTANDAISAIVRDKNLLERKLTKIDPEAMSFSNKLANIIRDVPVLDFIDPYYEVKQVVVNDLDEDLVFMGMPKVDRCMTCHMGIDKKGFENQPQPYTTHPRLDEFVGESSAHPMSLYGCTSCHGGRGRGTGFTSSVHMPQNEEQAHEWEMKYNWEALHHWEDKMLPLQYTEAGCYKCHSDNMPIKGAETLSLGLATFEKSGCYSCHEMERWAEAPKPGPSLYKMASKTTRDWSYRWIMEPRSFRHNTWMPHFFKKGNNSSTDDLARTEQEVLAMTEYLFENSIEYSQKKSPSEGDPDNGRLLVSSYGCMGCHQIEPTPNPDYESSIQALRIEQGPNLIGLGSKTNKQWLFNWLQNPYSYHPDTKMPNLRLSDQEATDIASYLIKDKNIIFDSTEVPKPNNDILNKISSDFLSQIYTSNQVEKKLLNMTIQEKQIYSGEKLIGHYGCYSCHNIDGFENKKPIGISLNYEGSKLISKLDFGLWHEKIPHTKWDWFYNKINQPEIFDLIPKEDGSVTVKKLKPLEKSRMPHYGLNDKEITSLVTLIMGLVNDEIPESKLPEKTPAFVAVSKGEQFIHTNNCLGCHKIDGEGGAIWPSTAKWLKEVADQTNAEDMSLVQSFSPPLLNTQGRKTQPQWLLNWFKNISMVRPHLQARMPSFDYTDEEWNKVIAYFQYKDKLSLTYENPHQFTLNSESYKAGEIIQEMGACNNCHFYGDEKPKQAALTWAPNLVLSKERLRPEWLIEWYTDPQKIMPGTKMPAPYIPMEEPVNSVREVWGSEVANLMGDSTRLYTTLIDWKWGIEGPKDVSAIVRQHLEIEGYGFIIEEDDDWGDDDW